MSHAKFVARGHRAPDLPHVNPRHDFGQPVLKLRYNVKKITARAELQGQHAYWFVCIQGRLCKTCQLPRSLELDHTWLAPKQFKRLNFTHKGFVAVFSGLQDL